MRAFVVRNGETHQQYLGDGVYASHDGYQIWLRAEAGGQLNEIALEPGVFEALKRYANNLKKENVK